MMMIIRVSLTPEELSAATWTYLGGASSGASTTATKATVKPPEEAPAPLGCLGLMRTRSASLRLQPSHVHHRVHLGFHLPSR